jgi:hypothetical protein
MISGVRYQHTIAHNFTHNADFRLARTYCGSAARQEHAGRVLPAFLNQETDSHQNPAPAADAGFFVDFTEC